MTEYSSRDQRAEAEADFAHLTPDDSETNEISTVISVRLRADELAAVENAAQATGLKLSTFIRQAALTAATPLDVRAASARAEAIQAEARKLLALLHGEQVA